MLPIPAIFFWSSRKPFTLSLSPRPRGGGAAAGGARPPRGGEHGATGARGPPKKWAGRGRRGVSTGGSGGVGGGCGGVGGEQGLRRKFSNVEGGTSDLVHAGQHQ